MESDKLKHLEMIQGVINRMAHNSFLIKGWSVVVVSALFALSAKNSNYGFVILAFFPAVMFWGLDAFYLRQERLFRALYDEARTKKEEMDFSMNTESAQGKVDSWFKTLFSKTIFPFHACIIVSILIVSYVLFVNAESSIQHRWRTTL